MDKIDKYNNGDLKSYLMSLLIMSLAIIVLVKAYFVFDPFFMEIWGSRSTWYANVYRAPGALVWKALHFITSSWIYVIIPIAWMLSAFKIQSNMAKEKAKKFNKRHASVIFIVSFIVLLAFMHLILGPIRTGL
jgi:hypothetical protein